MARPQKKGFEQFLVDVDFADDDKIVRLRNTCGCEGVVVYIYLLSRIFGDEGYFFRWGKSCAEDVANRWSIKTSRVEDTIDFCLKLGLFDRVVLLREGVLTSKSIQERYLRMSKRRRVAEISENYRSIIVTETPVIAVKTPVIAVKTPVIAVKTPQKKDKKENPPHTPSYKKEKKENTTTTTTTRLCAQDTAERFKETWNANVNYYKSAFRPISKLTKCRREAISHILATFSGEELGKFCQMACTNPALNGKTGSRKGKVADFDWLIADDERIVKIMEGNFQ